MMKKNIPILMYHSIEKMPKTTVMRSLHVAPIRFKFQMWLLNLLGYKGLSIRELTPYLKKQKIGKVVGITFDDGYQNNLINAAPVLKKYNFSATCFIVSDRIGSSNVWDSEKGITQRSLMTSNEIQAWLDLGMDIGAHTKTHVDLISSNEIEIKKQIKESKVDLEKKFNLKIVDFCYPFGYYNKAVVDIVEDSGYESAVTMNRGRVKDFPSQFELPRIPINHHTLPHLFLMKVLTRYEDKK
jgi:peptidoglycan/xylan/chitin deacetylase (PgdA/CDA1 family)